MSAVSGLWEQFSEQARRTPEAEAVRWPGGVLRYTEAHAEAQRVAGALASAGITAGSVVALGGDVDGRFVARLLGVLARGGVVCLVEDELRRQELGAIPIESFVESFVDSFVDSETANPNESLVGRGPGDPAAVAFTSGLSGGPRAVFVPHGAVSQFVGWVRERYGIGPGDRVSLLLPRSFYGAIGELLLPLICGATLCVPSAADKQPPGALAWIRSAGITVVHGLPGQTREWLRGASGEAAICERLRLVMFTGECLMASHVDAWQIAAPGARLVNLYGHAETGLACSAYEIVDSPEAGVQCIGLPLPGIEVEIVSPRGTPYGVGEPGEVAVRTPLLSNGYAGGPCNAGGLVEGPRGTDFRTGDLGVLRADGTLEIRGRLDERVKIQGIRLDLATVEAALMELPQIEAVALAPEPGGTERLVAFVIPRARLSSTAALRARIAQTTEQHPADCPVVLVERFPRLPSGKVDRAKLTATATTEALSEPHDEPAERAWTPTEEQVADVWMELIGTRPLRLSDDFFTFGGSSLQLLELARLSARLHLSFNTTLPLRRLLRGSTLRQMAFAIDSARLDPTQHRSAAGQIEPAPAVVPSRRVRLLWGMANAAALAILLGALALLGARACSP